MQGNPGPISTGVATEPQLAQFGIDGQIRKYKDEESSYYGQRPLPFPLDQIPQILDRVKTPLLNLGSLLIQAQQNPEVVDVNIDQFSVVIDKVDKLNADIIDLYKEVSKMYL